MQQYLVFFNSQNIANGLLTYLYITDLKTKTKDNILLSMSRQSVLSSKCFFEWMLLPRLHFCQNSIYLQTIQYACGFAMQDYFLTYLIICFYV